MALPSEARCEIALSLTNTGAKPMPAGLGLHPYFASARATQLMLDAAREWPMDRANLSLPAPGGALSWAGPLEGPVTRQVTAWNGRARLRRPEADIMLEATPELGCLVLHRPANAEFLCLEPVSHIADAFNLAAVGVDGTGARSLAPGASLAAQLALSLTPAPSSAHEVVRR